MTLSSPTVRQSILLLLTLSLMACGERNRRLDHVEVDKLFSLMPTEYTGVDFVNRLHETQDFNVFTYRNYHNGGGVAVADFNADGLPDLYFTANQEHNRMYLNEGNFRFRDITRAAGVAGRRPWSTGVTAADVNGDGLTDIYVSNAGQGGPDERANELFINNGVRDDGIPTFTESAEEYGIADRGYSVQGAFFDSDADGDLDLYVLNNSPRSVTSFGLRNIRDVREPYGGDRLYRNEEGRFSDVSESAGIYGTEIAFGLDVTVSDLNQDGLPDIFVSNDFFERDYLYMNNGDGTFAERLTDAMRLTSLSSMGADAADLDNNGYPDIYVTDMLPAADHRMKMTSTFEEWEVRQLKVDNGFYHQFMRNTLQRNNADGTFSEVGQMAGVEATDWSWGTLIADFDLDGRKDIFVTNGVFRDVTDQDFIDFLADGENARAMSRPGVGIDFTSLTERIPSHRLSNFFFRNEGELAFVEQALDFGLDTPGFSNGTAYGDLDNDGDLDLVVNNVNEPAFIYRNESDSLLENRFLRIRLEGSDANTQGIGALVTVRSPEETQYFEQIPTRGFQSSVDPVLVVGLGSADIAEAVTVRWQGGTAETRRGVPAGQMLVFREDDGRPAQPVAPASIDRSSASTRDLVQSDEAIRATAPSNGGASAGASNRKVFSGVMTGLEHRHRENDFIDFSREPLLVKMLSRDGPRSAVGDVNGDGLADVYIGGAKNQSGALFVRASGGPSGAGGDVANARSGRGGGVASAPSGPGGGAAYDMYERRSVSVFEEDSISEDVGAAFFDADGDGDLDLFVVSGGNEYSEAAPALRDRLYLNDGRGGFTRGTLPAKYYSGSVAAPADFDRDGDVDLFVGSRLLPWRYGIPPTSALLENDGSGSFTDATEDLAPDLVEGGMVTDAVWTDYDGDGALDLVVVGDWMPITFFRNRGGRLEKDRTIENSSGWWNRILAHDLDNDGDSDFVAGNLGLNTRLRASAERPLSMHVHDYDRNGFIEQIVSYYNDDTSFPLVLRRPLLQRLPFLQERFPTHASYAGETLAEVLRPDELEGGLEYFAHEMASSIILNEGDGSFRLQPLPDEAQLAPVHALAVDDFDGDGNADILLAGNFSGFKPELGGATASRGLLLLGDGSGAFTPIAAEASGINIDGDIRDVALVGDLVVFVRNDGPSQVLLRP